MSVPAFDLRKVQFASQANAFKNDGFIYGGSIDTTTSIASGSFHVSSQSFDLPTQPVFSQLYGYFQEYVDTFQQYYTGSGYQTEQWWNASVNNKIGFVVTAPGPQAGPLDGIIYPVINGNTITVNVLINNPYAATITITAQTIEYAFITYTMTN